MERKKIHLSEFYVEITRKCNMNCLHCLRGDAQNVEIKYGYITNVLKDVSTIDSFTITGGEPSLNVGAIQFILNELKRFNIIVGSFYIITNGRKTSQNQEFLYTLLDLYYYQQYNASECFSMVQISKDNYHNHEEEQEESIEKLSAFSFFSVRETTFKYDNIIAEGRGCEIGEKTLTYDNEIEYDIWGDNVTIESMVYLNAKGQICNNCDYSYNTQEEQHLFDINNISFYDGLMNYIN